MDDVSGFSLEVVDAATIERIVDRFDGFFYRCIADSNFTMTYVSKGIERITGFPYGEFIGDARSYMSIVHADDVDLVNDTIGKALVLRQTWNMDYRLIGRSGNTIWLNEVGAGIFSDTDELESLEGVLTIVSDKKRIEEHKLQLMAAAVDASASVITATRGIMQVLARLKMLSLNARIEAPKAGEGGRGFSVVAAEIGALAEETGMMAETIEDTIEVFQNLLER